MKKNLETFKKHQKILQDEPAAKDIDNAPWLVCQRKLKEHLHVLSDRLESEETDVRFLFKNPPWQALRKQHNKFIRNFEEQCKLSYEGIAFEASVAVSGGRQLKKLAFAYYEFAFESEMTDLFIHHLLSKKLVRPEDLYLLNAA